MSGASDGVCRLLLGDCLEKMGEIEAGSVDLIAADLPYGTTNCRWDSVIPFEPMWDHFRRVLKPCGAVVLTASQPFTSALVMSNPKWFRYEWAWDKVNRNTGALNAKKMPLKRHENILVFYRSASTYNPQYRPGKPYIAHRTNGHGAHTRYGRDADDRSTVNDGNYYPSSVLEIPADLKIEMGLHPTQKPVALFEYLIRTYSNEGETVLDPTFGSGTTGVACLNTNRRFIGIERDPSYFATATARIAAARAAHPLFSGSPA
jgi:DNA modification methylase